MNLNQKSALEGKANACIGLPSYFILTAKALRDIRIEHAGWRQSVGAAKSMLCPSIAKVLIYAGKSAYYFEANMRYIGMVLSRKKERGEKGVICRGESSTWGDETGNTWEGKITSALPASSHGVNTMIAWTSAS